MSSVIITLLIIGVTPRSTFRGIRSRVICPVISGYEVPWTSKYSDPESHHVLPELVLMPYSHLHNAEEDGKLEIQWNQNLFYKYPANY